MNPLREYLTERPAQEREQLRTLDRDGRQLYVDSLVCEPGGDRVLIVRGEALGLAEGWLNVELPDGAMVTFEVQCSANEWWPICGGLVVDDGRCA